jgi:ArsR family transcriptional regulator
MRIYISMPRQGSANLLRLFRALADPTRLRLLNLMADQEVCVCYLVEILGLPQPKISRHLAYLRAAGLVDARRDGKWMHYKIAALPDSGVEQMLRFTLEQLREDRAMRADLARLNRACCAPARYGLSSAPLPQTIPAPCCEVR